MHTLNTVASNFNSAQTIQHSMNVKGYIYSMEGVVEKWDGDRRKIAGKLLEV